MSKAKVVLDADVIIHFSKGGCLSILPTILSGYKHIILDKVYEEIKHSIKNQLDNQINLLGNIKVEKYIRITSYNVCYTKLLRKRTLPCVW